MQEWYLMTHETRPNITGGFENDAFLDYKEDAFAEALSTDIAKTVILCNSDMTEIGEIRVIIMDNLANTQLKSMERSVFAVIGTLKAGMYSILKNGECTSASGVVNEYKYNKKLAPYIKKYLEKVGCTVDIINVPEKKYTSKSSEKTYKLEKINGHKYDMAIELHLNCANGKAHGCEVYYVSSKGKEIAQRIDKKLGTVFTDRGVKTAQLYFLTKTDCPSALVESFFCGKW